MKNFVVNCLQFFHHFPRRTATGKVPKKTAPTTTQARLQRLRRRKKSMKRKSISQLALQYERALTRCFNAAARAAALRRQINARWRAANIRDVRISQLEELR